MNADSIGVHLRQKDRSLTVAAPITGGNACVAHYAVESCFCSSLVHYAARRGVKYALSATARLRVPMLRRAWRRAVAKLAALRRKAHSGIGLLASTTAYIGRMERAGSVSMLVKYEAAG